VTRSCRLQPSARSIETLAPPDVAGALERSPCGVDVFGPEHLGVGHLAHVGLAALTLVAAVVPLGIAWTGKAITPEDAKDAKD